MMLSKGFIEQAKKPKGADISGQKFGMLTAIKRIGKDNHNNALWLCECDCGNECVRPVVELRRRDNHSCGCKAKENLAKMAKGNITHGMTGSRLLGCYKAMMSRCYREKDIHYNAYGKRGITVCDEWNCHSDAFIEWALNNGYSDDLTLERIDVNGNYEPSNCTWIPMSEQYKNKQSNCHKQMPLPEPWKGEKE